MNVAKPNLFFSLLPLGVLIALLAFNVTVFGDNSLSFSNQVVLLIAAGVSGLIGKMQKVTFADLMDGANENIKQAVPALLILLLIGSLAASWLLSGIVPAMIYYGLKLLSPDWFLVSACIICALVSIATGSSWGTIATVGIALLGIGKTMDFSEGLVAGAIISGAYFGDKMSPLSDTTNLAPAVSGTDLISHIKYMTITTVPSIVITLIIFTFIGFFHNGSGSLIEIEAVNNEILNLFSINPALFLVPIVVIVLIVKRIPAAPALGIGTLLGLVFAFLFQMPLIESLAEEFTLRGIYSLVLTTLGEGLVIHSDNAFLSDLLSSSGMKGMLDTIWLIICAMIFGGVMDKSGCLATISRSLLKLTVGKTSLVGTTALSSIFMNLTASDQYLAIVVPGKMYQEAYKDYNLHPVNLSRTLEDAGTVTSVLIPWNTCGAAQASVLGVATGVYWPYCFFCIISPFMTMLIVSLNYKIRTLN
jgi:NhaC family Na+:H+ antiporter